jgi:hypothetical protein
MATTTTNYGFDVPTSSDLVKNGATQIALLGQDLDTFLFRPFTRNGVINGSFDIWQRGTSFAAPTTNTFVADRWAWQSSSVASKTISRQASGLTGFQYSIRVARDSGNTNTASNYIGYSMESADAYRFAGQTVTFSFYAKAGANYSPTSSLLGYRLGSGTGTDQNFLTGGYTGSVNVLDATQAITTTWTRYSFTAAVGSTATELGLFFYSTPTGTAGANDWFEITGVQVEVGSQVSPFIRAGGGAIQAELAMCLRYYDKRGGQTGTGTVIANAMSNSAGTNALFSIPIAMRVAPTSVDTANLRLSDTSSGFTVSSVTLSNSTPTTACFNVATTGMTGFRSCYLDSSATGNYIAFSAEL